MYESSFLDGCDRLIAFDADTTKAHSERRIHP